MITFIPLHSTQDLHIFVFFFLRGHYNKETLYELKMHIQSSTYN